MKSPRRLEAADDADLDENLLTLRSSTLTALTSFLDEQAAGFETIISLTTQPYPPYVNPLQRDHAINEAHAEISRSRPSEDQTNPEHPSEETQGGDICVPVDRFKRVFKENWQLSQFWYTQDTAVRLGRALREVCSINAHIAFVCCPTGYVAFRGISLPTQRTLLLEYDRRFSIVAGASFVHYDLDAPLSFPRMEALSSSQDVVVVDPPFHSEVSQRKIASTVAHILRPGGRLVLLTGLTLSSLIDSVYQPPLPKLRRRGIVIEHDGVGRLATPYGCWTGGGPDGQVEEEFGELIQDESY